MPRSEQIPFEGVLNCWNDEHDLPDLLLAMSRTGKTGRLHFSNPEGDKTLFVKEGRIVFAQSSSNDDGLGQFLLRMGQISLMEYAKVTHLVQPGKRLGALLVEHGFLEPTELVPAVRGQVRAIILGLFRRTETWYRFKEEPLPPKEAITLDMPMAQLIVDGVQYVESWRRISKGVGELESVYRLSEAGKKEFDAIELEGSVMELLEMLEEPVPLVHICQNATLPDFEVCRYLWAFRSLDWIELAEAGASDTASDTDAKAQPSKVITAPAVTRPSLDSTVAAATAETPAAGASKPATSPPGTSRPPTPDPALVQTQVAAEVPSTVERQDDPEPSATPKPIPESLVQTKIAVERPQPPKPDSAHTLRAENGSPGPKPIPENLVQTRVAMEPPTPPAKTETPEPPTPPPPSPPAPTPKPIPENLSSTQLYMSHPDVESPEPAAPTAPPQLSTQDRMEAILKGEDEARASSPRATEDASKTSAPPPRPESAPEAPSADSTQIFAGADALAGPGPDAEDSYADFTPSGFEALAGGNDMEVRPPVSGPTTMPSVSPPEAPAPGGPPTVADDAMTSFGDLAYGDESFANVKPEEVIDSAPPPEPFVPHEPGPVEQPTVVEDVEIMDAEPLPTVEAVTLPAEPKEQASAEAPSGMEAFIVPSPTDTGGAPQFATDDPMRGASASDPPIPPPPKRRKTEDVDFDMDGLGHVLGDQ